MGYLVAAAVVDQPGLYCSFSVIRRVVPDVEHAVLSPADGRIVVIEKTEDIYGKREALKISVFMNVFNVHSNRSPVDGKVESVHYFPGKFVNADLDKASLENERNALIIKTQNGQTVTCVQVARSHCAPDPLLCRRWRDFAKGTTISDFIRFGSRVDVYLRFPQGRKSLWVIKCMLRKPFWLNCKSLFPGPTHDHLKT